MKNRKLIILLIIIVAMLIIALGVAIVYVLMQRQQGTENQIVSNTKRNTVNSGVNVNNSSVGNSINATDNTTDDTTNNTTTANNTIDNTTNTIDNNAVANANQTAISTFNEMFSSYVGNAKTGTQVLTLLSIIDNNNVTNTEHKVNLINSGITSSTPIDADKKYNVELFYDTEGYVNNIEIKEYTGTSEEDIEKARFNNEYISFYGNGEITGENVKKLIDKILENNASNPEHQIAVKTDTLQGIADIVDTETYLIRLSYDENNWVNTVVLDKKV